MDIGKTVMGLERIDCVDVNQIKGKKLKASAPAARQQFLVPIQTFRTFPENQPVREKL